MPRPTRSPSIPGARSRPVATGAACAVCAEDLTFLRTGDRPDYETPDYETGDQTLHVVDLFAGGGGLTLGAAEAARRAGLATSVVLAVEQDRAAHEVYKRNFPKAALECKDVTVLFDGELGAKATHVERQLAERIGLVDLLLAGPPCQGHSDLNNRTRRQDPRNALYLRAARAAEILRPTFVVIENVPAVRHDRGTVVEKATIALRSAGYQVADDVLDLVRFGVPQRRRRHILVAVRDALMDPAVLLDIESPCEVHGARSVRWAIGDLQDMPTRTGPDIPSTPTTTNLARMQWLIDHDEYDLPNEERPRCHRDKAHTYKAMYGRLHWDEPAPTITTGFGSMGQGRFVHPGAPRTITPHEAARLQTLPDFFDLDETKGRSTWARVIGNAVPPLLGVHLIEPLLCTLFAPVPKHAEISEKGLAEPKRARTNGTPLASSELVRKRMTSTKRRNTKPELELRRALFRMGLRFRVDVPIDGSRRRTDIVFRSDRLAVYVDGCFWHSCPEHGSVPKQNTEWWIDKLGANVARDADTDARLRNDGWTVLRFWEHEDPGVAAEVVAGELLALRAAAPLEQRALQR
jgi:DNA (cytosine-5)-methyltransferase 1